jgi:hypothetical protein
VHTFQKQHLVLGTVGLINPFHGTDFGQGLPVSFPFYGCEPSLPNSTWNSSPNASGGRS